MKAIKVMQQFGLIASLVLCVTATAIGQGVEGLQLTELTKKLQLTEQQQKAMAPIIAKRDEQAKALKANTSMGKLQKLRKLEEIQTNFRTQSAKVLTPEQNKKLETLQAERRSKLMGS
jgi:Spy/CpxP family protein refolding chaperone